jgi:ribosomal RNA-processing protein 12
MTDSQTKKTSSGNAFDDILYNSDSDAESENDVPAAEQSGPNATRGKGPQPTQSSQFQSRKGAPVQKEKKERKLKDTTSYIRNEGDEPMDLLSRGIAGGVASESFSFFYSYILRRKTTGSVRRGRTRGGRGMWTKVRMS